MPSNRYFAIDGFPVPCKPKLYRTNGKCSYPACGNSINTPVISYGLRLTLSVQAIRMLLTNILPAASFVIRKRVPRRLRYRTIFHAKDTLGFRIVEVAHTRMLRTYAWVALWQRL